MSTEFDYKGYKGSCLTSIEDECLHGRIRDIDDLISYEGNTVGELRSAFQLAVDEYLEHCISIGKEPNKPYSGSFNVRIGSELHKIAAQRSRVKDESLNEFVRLAIEHACSNPTEPIRHEVTVNHVIRHQTVDTTFFDEDTSWVKKTPQLRIVQ
ncbi:MAG: type II toxin-antitoxin system HicB family antitoxin [Gallionella sp.]